MVPWPCGGLAVPSRSLEAQSPLECDLGPWTHTPHGQRGWDPGHFLFQVYPLVFPPSLTKKGRIICDPGIDSLPSDRGRFSPTQVSAGVALILARPGEGSWHPSRASTQPSAGASAHFLFVPPWAGGAKDRCPLLRHLPSEAQWGTQDEHRPVALLWVPRHCHTPQTPHLHCLASAQPGAAHYLSPFPHPGAQPF